jgi:ATP-binding cassette, subfamily B, bacterial
MQRTRIQPNAVAQDIRTRSISSRLFAWLGGSVWLALRTIAARLYRRRVPVMLQLSMFECGGACLAMVLNYYGRKTRVAECREACGIGRDGTTVQTIAEAARRYGLRSKAFSIELADFRHMPLPAIVHWNFNHFVVVERWSPRSVTIVDPARGRRRLTPDEFDAGFTGVVLALEPGVQFERARAQARPVWRSYLMSILRARGTAGMLAQILAASFCLQLLGLALPVFAKVLVDYVLPFRIDAVMPLLGIGIGVLVLTQIVISYLRAALLITLQGRLDSHLMLGFFEHVLNLPFRFFQERTSGDLLMRLGSNMFIREILTSQTLSICLDSAFVLGYLAILMARLPSFGLLVLGLGALQMAILLGSNRRVHGLMQRYLVAQSESQGYLVEAMSGMGALKASGSEDRVLDHWSTLFFKQLNISLERSYISAVIETALGAIRTFSPLALLWVGALWVLDGTISLGTMLALNALGSAILTPLASLVSSGQQLQLVGAHLDRLSDVLEADPEQDPRAVQVAPPLTGAIELKQVGFRYAPNAPWVLQNISVTIEPGQKVALVGRSGSGKSTLAKLLLGLYLPTEGDILYDGVPLRQIDYRTLRSQFGVMLQESFLFNNSIRQNITFNAPRRSLDEVIAAARMAEVHDDIMEMPMGYETLLAEGGASLSGGQRQRLELARALVNQPAILLLDEATSHLDAVTEQLVDQHLNDLSCTRIVIAHRLSTIQNADLILVFQGGAIVERGTHAELLARGGYYAALVDSQREEQVRG